MIKSMTESPLKAIMFGLSFVVFAIAAIADQEESNIDNNDIEGKWHEIGRMANEFQDYKNGDKCIDSSYTFSQNQGEDDFNVQFSCQLVNKDGKNLDIQTISASANFSETSHLAHLKIDFVRDLPWYKKLLFCPCFSWNQPEDFIFYSYMAEDGLALVGNRDGSHLAILSKAEKPNMDAAFDLLDQAEKQFKLKTSGFEFSATGEAETKTIVF